MEPNKNQNQTEIRVKKVDVAVIGAGPAGLAAAVSAKEAGADVLIIEREERPGGILKQCIHDGFGLRRFLLEVVSRKGLVLVDAGAVISATGCRERTDRQILIQGNRPSGIFTAGQAQYFINIQGYMPVKKALILGSGDIGLIMARRLTLEGAEVEGVYEVKSEPSGLTRNIVQCLNDFNIPLYLSSTVLSVQGRERVESVTIASVDERMRPIPGTERVVECDSLILSVGLIPENDILEQLGVEINSRTKGPTVSQRMETSVPALFSCGNALHVNDLADFVSESGEAAGRNAAALTQTGAVKTEKVSLNPDSTLLYCVPQSIEVGIEEPAVVYFRSAKTLRKALFEIVDSEGAVLYSKKYIIVKPPEMERVLLSDELFQNLLKEGKRELFLSISGQSVEEEENGN